MFERLHQDARAAVERSRHEAASAGREHIGCEHVLLGLLAGPGVASQALTAAGLGLSGLRALVPPASAAAPDPLDADALATLGIDLDAVRRATNAAFGQGALDRVSAPRRDKLRVTGGVGLSTEARKSIEIAMRSAVKDRKGRLTSGHLLIGILDQADNGGVDALRAAGIDTSALRADVLRRMTPDP